MPHIEYVREAGSEAIELVMWLIMRGAIDEKAKEIYRFYHVPASNTAVGHYDFRKRRVRGSSLHYMKVVVGWARCVRQKHLDGIARIDGVEVASLVGGNQESTKAVAAKYGIPHYTGDLAEALAQPGVEAAILATPTQMHAKQGEQVMRAGKHVEIEIPVSDTLAEAERLLAVQKETGVIGMGGHTRRFNPSHQYIHNKIKAGELKVLQMDVQTYFFRRTNMNAAGQPRSWTDHLLVASRLPHRRPVPVPDRSDGDGRARDRRPDAPAAQDLDGHGHSDEGAERRDLHALALVQQRRPVRNVLPLHLR